MSDNLKAAAFAAGLSAAEKKRIDELNKALNTHRELSNLPAEVAVVEFDKKTPEQKASLVGLNGTEDPAIKPNQGWLGTAWHYTGGAIGKGFQMGLAGLSNVSDLTTRLYRTGAVALTQNVDLGKAWDIANDKGDKVFNPGRIDEARQKYGNAAISVAMRIAAGESPDQIAPSATPEELKYLRLVDKNQGLTNETKFAKAERDNFQDALDAVNASKYSPGRQVANLILPRQLEGSGFFYKAISGAVDAAYRVFVDPLLVAGKAKRLYDIKNYAIEVLVGDAAKGGTKLKEYFDKPEAIDFWNKYGAKLDQFKKARAEGQTAVALSAKNDLKILAPQFGPAVIDDFLKADKPIVDALTAKSYFENADQAINMMKGGVGRRRVLAPVMNNSRKLRVAAYTTANKVFNLNKMGSDLTEQLFFGAAATNDGIVEKIINGQKEIVEQATAKTPSKDAARFSMAMIQRRIDGFKAKFETIPYFKDNMLDVTDPQAGEQIYRLARLVLPQRESRLISEAFDSIEDINQRKDIFYGVWNTIADIRGINVVEGGQTVTRKMSIKAKPSFSVGKHSTLDDGTEVAILPSDNSKFVTAPSIADIDLLVSRTALTQKLLGVMNSKFVENMTAGWSFLTLAGPRYALRNATEDLMVNLAIGTSPWAVAKARIASTRLGTAKGLEKGLTKSERIAANPLGAVLRIVNKKEAQGFAKEMDNIEETISTARSEISTLRAQMKASKDDVVKANLKSQIDELQKKTKGGAVYQRRVILARALNEGKLNRAFKRLGIKQLDEEGKSLLAEQIMHGDLDNALEDIVEGSKNFAVGLDYNTRAINFTREHGVRSVALRIEAPRRYTRARGATGYRVQALQPADEPAMVAWMMRISYYANDELGAIAVANLDNREVAVGKIFDWLMDPKNKKVVDAFRLESNGISKQQHAEIVYKAARELFETRKVLDDGSRAINIDLLNKVRVKTEDGYQVTGKLTLDDLPTSADDVPEYVVGPTLVAVSDTGNYTSSLMEKGWTWLGLSNSRMSREPLVLAEMIKMRKEMRKSGFEDAFIKAHVKNVDPDNLKAVEKATDFAKKKLAEIVEDRARLQILDYVDNPMVRSQLAFSVRNFARFYRATEDFYRRMSRVVRYNPEAIVKAALTYEGVTHSGWIQRDDQGEPYFVYPGVEPVYRAVQAAMVGLGIPAEFRVPLPVQFGAQVKMITPSLNPDSIIPTFAGPVSGVSLKVITNLVDIFSPGAADTITRVTMGKYAVDQPMVSAFLPAHVNRLYATMNRDERDSQYASAWRKAVTYLEAGGHGLPKRYDADGNLIPPTAGELEDYRIKVKNTTLSILGTRFVFGFFAPASPQVQLKSDMAEWVRDNGRANFKQVWNKLLDQYPGDYDKAMAKWVELYPDQIPFTVTESERKSTAYFRYAEESGAFVDQNKALFEKYPQGAAFLIPHKAGFSWDAYKTMTDMGLIRNKRVDEYLREVQTSADLQAYYAKKEEHEKALTTAGIDSERTRLRAEFNDWKTLFFAGRPLVAEELSQGSQKAIDRLKALDDLRAMLQDKDIKARPNTQTVLKKMIDLYDNLKLQKQAYADIPRSRDIIQSIEDQTIAEMQNLAGTNENAQAAYDVLFGRLLGA